MGQRIRTLKPGCWADEEISSLSRDARLLFTVLITFADDDGRFRDLPAQIIGFGYPEDPGVTPRKIEAWMAELAATGIVWRYKAAGKQYATFPNWHRHQHINRYTPSRLPPVPLTDPVVIVPHKSRASLTEDSVSPHDTLTERSLPDRERGEEGSTPLAPQGGKSRTRHGVGEEAPLKPTGKRKTMLAEHDAEMAAWAAHHFPGAERGAVGAGVSWLSVRTDGPVTAADLRKLAASSETWAGQLGLVESPDRDEAA